MDQMRVKFENMLNTLKSNSDESLDEILTSFKEVSEVMKNIKAASQEQALGVNQINQTITEMNHITQENSLLVEQNSTASQQMVCEAEHLQTLLSSFKVGKTDVVAIEGNNLQIEKDRVEQITGNIVDHREKDFQK